MRLVGHVLALALASGCSASSSAPSCASGVYADGRCLTASHVGASGGSGGAAPSGTDVGATCSQSRALACGKIAGGMENDRVVVCEDGAFSEILPCAPPAVCADLAGHTSVHCGPPDEAVPYAIEGDPCTPESAAACPIDRARLLVCKSAIWTGAETCAPGLVCHRTSAGTQGAGWSCPPTSQNGCVVCAP